MIFLLNVLCLGKYVSCTKKIVSLSCILYICNNSIMSMLEQETEIDEIAFLNGVYFLKKFHFIQHCTL